VQPAPAEELLLRRRVRAFETADELPAPVSFEQALGALSDEERSFVRAFVEQPVATKAYLTIHPGASSKDTKNGAAKFMARHGVKSAIALGRREVAQTVAQAAKYDRQAAFHELDRAIGFAEQTDNATAMVRAVELRARLTGVLIDRQEVKQSGFQLVINERAPSGVVIEGEVVKPKGEK